MMSLSWGVKHKHQYQFYWMKIMELCDHAIVRSATQHLHGFYLDSFQPNKRHTCIRIYNDLYNQVNIVAPTRQTALDKV